MEVSGMEFFVASELSNSVLHDIVAAYTRLEFKEGRKQSPDFKVISQYEAKRAEVLGILYKSENFSSLASMNEIIEVYTPILKEVLKLEE